MFIIISGKTQYNFAKLAPVFTAKMHLSCIFNTLSHITKDFVNKKVVGAVYFVMYLYIKIKIYNCKSDL